MYKCTADDFNIKIGNVISTINARRIKQTF